MFQTIILILFQIGSIYLSIKNFNIDTNLMLTNSDLLRNLFVIGIQIPLLEEALFRSVLKQYLTDYTYGYYINAILFGMAHAQNYLLFGNIKMIIYQIVSATYVGYYVVQLDNFHHAFLVHACYNSFITIFIYLYGCYFRNNQPQCNKICVGVGDMIDTKPLFQNVIPFNMRCPNITRDDMIKCGGYRFIPKVNKEMQCRINKLNSITRNKKYTFSNIDRPIMYNVL
jgi:hypothetical protein